MNARLAFFRAGVARWIADRSASVLVVAGGKSDRDVFFELGFTNVVVSNLAQAPDEEVGPVRVGPPGSGRADVRGRRLRLRGRARRTAPLPVPAPGLLEMYRVARRGILAIDPPDNLAVRIMQRLRLAQVYECVAVDGHEGRAGGVDDTSVPNHIYRWTEREVEKTIRSYAPMAAHRFRYAYHLDAPAGEFINPSPIKRVAVRLLKPAYRLLTLVLPRQQNLFAFMVEKPVLPRDLHPWLVMAGEDVRFGRPGPERTDADHRRPPPARCGEGLEDRGLRRS